MEEVIGFLFGLGALVVVAWFYIFLPAGMAQRRGRSVLIWVLVSLIFSPIAAILLLMVLGDAGPGVVAPKTAAPKVSPPGVGTGRGPWDKGGKGDAGPGVVAPKTDAPKVSPPGVGTGRGPWDKGGKP